MSRLCQPRTTKERFRLPFDEETAAKLLKCAIAGEVSRFGGTFLYPDAVDSQVRNLAASLTSGRRYGVMLCGLCGNGKTTVMRAFQNLLNVIRIPDNYHRTVYGMPIVNAVHIAHLCRNSYTEFLRLCDMEMLGIDDMGIEPVEVQEFGNMHRPLTDLLARRYENRGFSFITTNLVPQQIRKLYGDRIADRLNEMVDKIVFDNPSFRINKVGRFCLAKGVKLVWLFHHSPAFCWNQSVLAMASGRPVWHGALAFSCEVCRGITAYGQ